MPPRKLAREAVTAVGSAGVKLGELHARLRKHVSPVYILAGAETFLREEAEKAVKSHLGEVQEIIFWAGEGSSLRDATEEALTLPFFHKRKLVVLREADEELKKNAGALKSYLRSPPEFSTLVIECSAERVPSFKGAVLVECPRLYETEYGRTGVSASSPLGRWLRARASRMRLELTPEAATHLIEAVGIDLRQLASSLDLIATNAKGKVVGGGEVEEMFPRSRTSPAYRLLDALFEGRRESAMELAREAFESGIEFSGGKVVRDGGRVASVYAAVLARELESLQLASAMLEEGERGGAVVKELRVPRHREAVFLDRAKGMKPETCARAMEILANAERGFKTGGVEPRLAVLEAVTRIGEVLRDVHG